MAQTGTGCINSSRKPQLALCGETFQGCITPAGAPRVQIPQTSGTYNSAGTPTNYDGCFDAQRRPSWTGLPDCPGCFPGCESQFVNVFDVRFSGMQAVVDGTYPEAVVEKFNDMRIRFDFTNYSGFCEWSSTNIWCPYNPCDPYGVPPGSPVSCGTGPFYYATLTVVPNVEIQIELYIAACLDGSMGPLLPAFIGAVPLDPYECPPALTVNNTVGSGDGGAAYGGQVRIVPRPAHTFLYDVNVDDRLEDLREATGSAPRGGLTASISLPAALGGHSSTGVPLEWLVGTNGVGLPYYDTLSELWDADTAGIWDSIIPIPLSDLKAQTSPGTKSEIIWNLLHAADSWVDGTGHGLIAHLFIMRYAYIDTSDAIHSYYSYMMLVYRDGVLVALGAQRNVASSSLAAWATLPLDSTYVPLYEPGTGNPIGDSSTVVVLPSYCQCDIWAECDCNEVGEDEEPCISYGVPCIDGRCRFRVTAAQRVSVICGDPPAIPEGYDGVFEDSNNWAVTLDVPRASPTDWPGKCMWRGCALVRDGSSDVGCRISVYLPMQGSSVAAHISFDYYATADCSAGPTYTYWSDWNVDTDGCEGYKDVTAGGSPLGVALISLEAPSVIIGDCYVAMD